MANMADWLHVSKVRGSGDATITVTADPNTGRNSRTSDINIIGDKYAVKSYKVVQNGASLFVNSCDADGDPQLNKITVSGEGAAGKAIFFRTNGASVMAVANTVNSWGSLSDGNISMNMDQSQGIKVNGYFYNNGSYSLSGGQATLKYLSANDSSINTSTGVPSEGDIGATHDYVGSFRLDIPANEGEIPVRYHISIRVYSDANYAGNSVTLQLTVEVSSTGPFLRVMNREGGTEFALNDTIATLDADGEGQDFFIDSNITWDIS